MIFNSVTYLLFLLLALGLYWSLPRNGRLAMLFVASLIFYGFWRVEFIPVMLVSVITDYVIAIKIHETGELRRRKVLLLISLAINLGLLGFFKYMLFFAENAVFVSQAIGTPLSMPTWSIILPLGISFYTFQSISYTIDVYRGLIEPERDFILFGDYVMFFPQLIAGPILRANEVIWQLDRRPVFSLADIGYGLRRVLYGLFLKVVLADNLAAIVDTGYALPPETLSAPDVLTLAFLFGFQIYFDFSAYSHIAIGSARMMGIKFPENFNFPYIAVSPRDFWRRWHISLSSWIRDYLYLPLAGVRVEDRSTGGLGQAVEGAPASKGTRAMFLTWAIMGLWHGAAWAFVLWGLWHAVLIYLYRRSRGMRERLPPRLRTIGGWCWTLPLVMLGWIPFRTQSIADTWTMWGHFFDLSRYSYLTMRENTYLAAAAVLLVTMLAPTVRDLSGAYLEHRPRLFFVAESAMMSVIVLLVFVYLRPINQFIYFQF